MIPLLNTPESSNDFIIFILPFISSFEISKVNPFPHLTAPFLLEVKLLTNPGKFSLVKGTATFISAFFSQIN